MATVYTPPRAFAEDTAPPPARAPLTDDQKSKLDALVAHLNGPSLTLPSTVSYVKAAQKARAKKSKDAAAWSGQPVTAGAKDEKLLPLSDLERCFLSNEQCQRFLRAVKWDLAAAFSRTEETIVWRREFEVDRINENPDMVEEESRTGKEVVMGWDYQRRPCLYMFPYRQNTNTLDRQIQFVVWCLERAVDLMGPEVENLCLLIDFGSGAGGSGQPTSMGQARRVLTILQTYYCERLGRALCVRIPGIFYTFYRFVSPFVDPVTKDKIRFNPDCRELVPPAQLDKEAFGGDYDFKYEHEKFWPAIHELAKERRHANFERWRKYGNGKCGVSEFIIKGGNDVAEEKQEDAKTSSGETSAAAAAAALASTDDDASDIATPAMTQSLRTSGQSSPAMPATPANKAFEDERSSSQRNVVSGDDADKTIDMSAPSSQLLGVEGGPGRERANSSDSFVTTQEAASPLLGSAEVRDDDRLEDTAMMQEKKANGGHVETLQGIETGIAGLAVKADGSIGAA